MELKIKAALLLQKCFSFQQSLGIIGGKPNHAMYFIGYVGQYQKLLIYIESVFLLHKI
jgi:Peptidase family C54